MEKLSYREHVLRGFGSRRSFGNPRALPKTPQRNSDIDFHDVFGGPPRCSMTEVRHSLGESVDSYSFTGGEETPPPRSPWSALSEKPVFGGDSPSRRRHLSNDFFDDIFKGDDSSSSTPRKPDRDIFSSSSASWISSPTRPLPPNRQPFTGGSSLPAHLSLSMKLPKGMDLPTFRSPCRSPIRNKDGCGSNGNGFPSSPSIGASRLAIETVVGQDDSRKGTRSSHHHIPLSHGFSVSGDVSGKAAESDRQDTQGQFVAAESDRQDTQGQFVAAASDRQDTQGQFVEKDRGSSEASNDNNQFHFSIYKWASKGVMLMMPAKGGNRSNAKERGKNESIVSGLPAPVLRGANLPSLVEIASTASTSFEFQCDSQDNVSSKGIKIIIKDNDHEDAEHPEPEASPAHNLDSHITEESGRGNTVRSSSSAGPPDIGLFKGVKEHKSETKSLGSLLMCRSDDTGMVEVIKPAGQQDGFPKLKTVSGGKADDSVKGKKPIGRKPILIHAETTHSNLHDEPLNSDEKMPGNRVKEKVKEFVKIFNQEASPNLMHAVDTRGHSFRRKEPGSCKVEDPVPVYATMVDRQDETNNENDGGILADTPVMVDEIVKQTVKKHTVANADANKIHDSSSERNDIPESYPESTPKEELENTEESHCEDLHVHCLVEQLPGCQKENPQPNRHQDDIKVSDAKVREWSSGKEGNIRSLLSTLQYVSIVFKQDMITSRSPSWRLSNSETTNITTTTVETGPSPGTENVSGKVLWPDSGWKPVPLAEIIEGTSVRRAYQKALLCLHPDKLQQRGAAVHQKYIAEKVFDILQEAWDHFNSVNPI